MAGMRVFQIRARSLDDPRPDAGAIVVAQDADEAMILLRKDINFAGYALPPAEMIPVDIDAAALALRLGQSGFFSPINKI
ncbi:MAG: hypothetical protein E6G69_15545 [Alphaproteobacteria bacterium]|nr:MAG: hypothetical protein E6G69_15545 [Alphaproteobacteria bacterium]